jgi:hypothetical protein
MADLSEDVEDLCWSNQLCLVSIDTAATVISLSVDNNKPFRCNSSLNCLNVPSVENDYISLKWLGYRSKEENKTPTVGVPAV